jgi:hypothetical protein
MRLIDAGAVRNALYAENAITMKGVAIINQFPTFEATPVVHGWWILREDGYCCSNCDIQAIYTGVELKYCPNCGAKMDGRSEGE